MKQPQSPKDDCDTPVKEASTNSLAVLEGRWTEQILSCLTSLQEVAQLSSRDLLVVGASSSEVMGKKIGSATSLQVGQVIVHAVSTFAKSHGFEIAFQCCEHLNRSLVMEREIARQRGYPEVTAIPVLGAGGAVAAQAYQSFHHPCLVAHVVAEAGIDIGDTFIGMHLRPVAVPVRGSYTSVGSAHVTMARTRPPLIGGHRAVYDPSIAAERWKQGQ
jgi:uncharacterized protein (TIGR01440 family)